MSSYEYVVAPASVDVLPSRVSRRITRRDGLLPLVLAAELAVGIAFGLASAAGASASAPPQPDLRPAASVTALSIGPVVPVTVAVARPTPYPTHAARNPFASLVRVTR